MINKKARIEWIDVAKGIGILCVFLGHLGVEIVDRIVFTFHMPLFFILSGMLLKVDVPLRSFIKQKSKRLLIPYYATGGIICILLVFADIFRNLWDKILPDIWAMLNAIIYGSCFRVSDTIDGVGALWFLWALFWACIIVKVLIPYSRSAVYICILSIFSYISTHYFCLPLSIQPGICASIFVYLGVRLQGINWKKELNAKRAFGALIIFVVEVILDIHLDMGQNIYNYGMISVLGAICICYLVIYISNLVRNKYLKKYFLIMGQYSLYILCIHQIEMRVFPWSIVLHLLEVCSVGRWFNLIVISVRIVGFYVCAMIWIKLRQAIDNSISKMHNSTA